MDSVRFGRGVRALRRHRGWRQLDLAAATGYTQTLISRIERGHADVVTPRVLEQIARPLGARVILRLDWQGEGLDRLLDERHASLVEAIVRVMRDRGWEAVVEASFAIAGERGSVDVLAWHVRTRSLLVVEVKSVLADVQDTVMRIDRKVRLAPRIAPAEWKPRGVSSLLVIEDTRTNRRRVETHSSVFESRFPDRAISVRRFIALPTDAPLRGLWFLSGSTHSHPRQRVRRS